MPPRSLAALVAVACRLDAAGVGWLVTGGTGRALLGGAGRPADLDLEVAGADAARAAAALGMRLSRDAGGGVSSRRARGRIAAVEVDLSADVAVRGPGGSLEPDWEAQWAAAVTVVAAGRPVRVAPPGEALARARALGDARRAERALAGLAADPRPGYAPARLARASSSATS